MYLKKFPFVPFLLAIGLAIHGLRRKSLSPSGALAAFIVGFIMMSGRVRTFGVSLIAFYLVGSRATKVGKLKKTNLEEGHQEAGYRSAQQVLCNSFSAFIATLVWIALFVPGSFIAKVVPDWIGLGGKEYIAGNLCPLSRAYGDGWSRFLLFIALGHFACCLGDTLASELGILSNAAPILITTFRRVPPGTNGGVSALGLIASVSGGGIMGLVMATSLAIESPACRNELATIFSELVVAGSLAGFFGSLIDSLMGATIQQTRYSSKTRRILLDDSPVPTPSSNEIKIVSGLNLLSNNQVNLISSIITALVTAYLA